MPQTRTEMLQELQALRDIEQIEAEIKLRASRNKIAAYYPETGPLRRELYVKHMELFAASAEHRELCFVGGNRTGKSEGVGAYSTSLHLTGRYPAWWSGRRFSKPIDAWAAGENSKTVHKEILQPKLLGPAGAIGTGMIPGDCIKRMVSRPGLPDAYETVYVHHVSGGISTLTFKSYEQGRESFQGTEKDWIWLDEEPKREIYVECVIRTMTTNGIVLCTFTPLYGETDLIRYFKGKRELGDSEASN